VFLELVQFHVGGDYVMSRSAGCCNIIVGVDTPQCSPWLWWKSFVKRLVGLILVDIETASSCFSVKGVCMVTWSLCESECHGRKVSMCLYRCLLTYLLHGASY
jgi:hypothetical protein